MHFDYSQCKQKGFAPIFILVGILVITAVAGGSYYFLKVKTPQPKACTQEAKLCPDGSSVGRSGPNCEFAACPTVKPSPTSLLPMVTENNETLTPELQKQIQPLEEIANWKTYTNTKFSFSLKHPKDWIVREKDRGVMWKSADYKSSDTGNIISGEEIDLFFDANPTRKSVENWWGKESTDYIISNQISFTVDGHKALKYNLIAPAGIVYGALVDDINSVFRFEVYATSDTAQNTIQIFNQILSTFKFQ